MLKSVFYSKNKIIAHKFRYIANYQSVSYFSILNHLISSGFSESGKEEPSPR